MVQADIRVRVKVPVALNTSVVPSGAKPVTVKVPLTVSSPRSRPLTLIRTTTLSSGLGPATEPENVARNVLAPVPSRHPC